MIARMPRQKEPQTVFGARLIEARRRRGMTQIELAEAIGSTQRAISYYEVQGGNPDLEVVAQLAKALGTTSDELLGLDSTESYEPEFQTVNERRLWRRFRKLLNLPEKDRRAVLRMLDSLDKTNADRKPRKPGSH
ncbi:MAG: helix-turn-helix transcriptional regulator [Planctomycetota bacterium]|jgi:transcriptional regulator with XRE-family HTH domain|nr:helix-turn-helix transcriptional regulator [Planctomycetota bacterium]